MALLYWHSTARISEEQTMAGAILHLIQLFLTGILQGRKCDWVDVLSNYPIDRTLDLNGSMPVTFVTGSFAADHSSNCLAMVLNDLESISELAKTSPPNAMIVIAGSKFRQDLAINSNRSLFYLEETDADMHDIHLFCPRLNDKGNWVEKLSIWNQRRKTFSPPLDRALLDQSCPHPLKRTKATVVYARRQLMAKPKADGTIAGAEADLLRALLSKHEMDLDFVQAGHNNLKISTHDTLVRIGCN